MKKLPLEKWKRVPIKYGNYEVSSHGRLRLNNKLLKCPRNSNGYPAKSNMLIHRMLCLAFGIIEETDHVNHIDGIKHNNHISNLEKSNPKHNMQHARRLGLINPVNGSDHHWSKLSDKDAKKIIKLYSEGIKISKLAEQFKMTTTTISGIALGWTWPHLNSYRDKMKIKRRMKIKRFNLNEKTYEAIKKEYWFNGSNRSNAAELCEKYEVCRTTIRSIVNGQRINYEREVGNG